MTVESKKPVWLIDFVSVAVVVVVLVLLAMPNKVELGPWTKQLPHVIGFVNSITCVLLVLGLAFIKGKKIALHRLAMSGAVLLGVVFLIAYVLYHMTNPASRLGAEGPIKWFYLFVLITHILLSPVVLPLVLRAMFFAVTEQYERHKKIVKYAYPIWLYVSVTGVIVYMLVHQIYSKVV